MKDLIQQRLSRYAIHSLHDEERALRILYGINRFSEDLNFALKSADALFDLETYLKRAIETTSAFGLNLEIGGRDRADKAVQSHFVKQDSLGRVFQLKFRHDERKKVKIKVEVDTHPPKGRDWGDVRPLLSEQGQLDFWQEDFFNYKLDKLITT